ncbi:MAG TPA: type II secretion system protein [Chthoniobacteraceae bacterium]|nr:type II secretion system protein [Chthoniobacteraceae bacterium]
MLPSSRRAFTLIEMLTVMLIIAILAGIVLSVNGLVQNKAARTRAEAEMKSLSVACESYKIDFGNFPRNTDTDALNARADLDPTDAKYKAAGKYLYIALSGDTDANGKVDPKEGKNYASDLFKPSVLKTTKDAGGSITGVEYIKDPFDNPYGYSTIGVAAEEAFADALRTNSAASRPASAGGYNPTFDLWSTGGTAGKSGTAGQAKWVKNW